MGTFWQDIRYSIRTLGRSPGFTTLAVLALALGIGANTAIFSVVYSMILRPLPGAERPHELVSVTMNDSEAIFPYNLSYASFQDYKSLKEIFSDACASMEIIASLSAQGGAPERVMPMVVTGNYFELLGVRPLHGRAFLREETERMGAGHVVVLSHKYWQKRFNSDTSVVGSVVKLNDQAFTVVGILPPEFTGSTGLFSPVAYLPVTGIDYIYPQYSKSIEERRKTGGFRFIGRLRPGVTLAEAQAAASTHAARLEKEFPETQKGQKALVTPEPRARMESAALQYMPPIVTVFMTLVGLVLLVACANVANLLLARATSRQKEMAIRAALGAGRLRILRQTLVESTLLALLGGALGLAFAHWPVQMLSSVRPATDLPISFDFVIDYRMFAFTLGLAVLAGIVSGLIPGLRISRTNLAATLKEGGRTSSDHGSRHWFRDLLVASQVAVSLVLLVCAGLFLRSTQNAARQDMGFDMKDRLIIAMDTEMRQYDEARGREFYRQLLDRVRSLPGVQAATTSAYLPIGFGSGMREILVEGQVPESDKALPIAFYNVVQTDYFRAMGMPILKGRDFDDNDTPESRPVAIVNSVMAEKMWPGEDPIGRRFSINGVKGPYREVVGVTRVVKFVLPAERPSPGYYLPYRQNYRSDQVLIVHTQGDALRLAPAVRAEVQALDTEMPIWDVRTMEEHILRGKMVLFHIATALVGGFGGIGLVLAAVGLYGVMAFIVGQRTHEIGVRMALGASPAGVLGMVVRQGLLKAAVGVALGLLGAFAVARLLTNYLVGVTPTDPLTFAMVTLFLAVVAAIASLAPAIRATRVDPVIALRSE